LLITKRKKDNEMSTTPFTYIDAIDDIELLVSENKLSEYSFEESLQCIIDELDIAEFDPEKDGGYRAWEERQYQDKQDLIRAHRETWLETKFTIRRCVKELGTDWIGFVVDDNSTTYPDHPVVVKFRDIQHLFYFTKAGKNYNGVCPSTIVLDSGLPK
jgi:hypothetical protein